jgi:hypothetical protein
VGGISADKSFPRVGQAGKRLFPSRLKLFVGSGSKYEEGIDFVGRLTKLLMFCCGKHNATTPEDAMDLSSGDDQQPSELSEGTRDVLRFFLFVKPYFNPSNVGAWTFPLGAFLHYFSYELGHRVGIMAGLDTLKAEHPDTEKQLCKEEPYLSCMHLPGNEIVAFLDSLLPLCQQALYSKNGNVSHAGETALLYLTQVDPARVASPMFDFALRALDISSVNLSHQAPAALSALSRLLQPALRHKPAVVLSRLPDMLRLTLAGIDSNDQNKTMRTLIFYRNLVMWLPVGGKIALPDGTDQNTVLDSSGEDGTLRIGINLMEARYAFAKSPSYEVAVAMLPQSSVLAQTEGMIDESPETAEALMEESMLAMSDW